MIFLVNSLIVVTNEDIIILSHVTTEARAPCIPRRDCNGWELSPENFNKNFALTSVLSREPLFRPWGGGGGLDHPPLPANLFLTSPVQSQNQELLHQLGANAQPLGQKQEGLLLRILVPQTGL